MMTVSLTTWLEKEIRESYKNQNVIWLDNIWKIAFSDLSTKCPNLTFVKICPSFRRNCCPFLVHVCRLLVTVWKGFLETSIVVLLTQVANTYSFPISWHLFFKNTTNSQQRIIIESTQNVMCNGNKVMYARVIRSESWLVVVKKVIFIDEIIDPVKDQFLKEFRAKG